MSPSATTKPAKTRTMDMFPGMQLSLLNEMWCEKKCEVERYAEYFRSWRYEPVV